MAKLPSISARPSPRKKASSSSTSSPKDRSSSHDVSNINSSVSKAAKRAAKRAQLLDHEADTPSSKTRPSSSPSLGLAPTISKSALRRRKRKIRDQTVLGSSGLDHIKDELQDLDDEEDDDDEAHIDAQLTATNEVALQQRKAEANQAAGHAKMGSKMRKKVLAQESLRQPHILKDLQQTGSKSSTDTPMNPFAMLRQHAQNSLGLNAPVVAAGKGKEASDRDVQMQ
ncbi:unnamed protein product [Sympodiomycopsis kandeliae]